MNNRDKAINKCLEELETDMELLGITGVEGKDDDYRCQTCLCR